MFACRSYVLVSSMLASSLLAMAILTAETENARSDVFQYEQQRQAVNDVRKYCGRKLSSTLQIICDGVYNSRFKKSNQDTEMDDYAFSYELHPYKSLKNARNMIRFRRDSRGIYEECCLKSCSTDELRSYCGAR